MRDFCARTVKNKWFDRIIVGLIIVNAAVLGLETSSGIYSKYGWLFVFINQFVLTIFII